MHKHKQKFFYHYDAQTKQFLLRTEAEYDPIRGDLMIPANCVLSKPPKVNKHQIAVWVDIDSKWAVVQNFIGRKVYLKANYEIHTIWSSLGAIDSQWTLRQPKTSHVKWSEHEDCWISDDQKLLENKLAARNYALCSTDWYVLRFIETGEPIPENVKAYRQKLRDMTSHKNWPKCRLPKLSCS